LKRERCLVGENESEKIFVGSHVHKASEKRTGYPNNLLPCIVLPAEAPSRAYMKIEEAIATLGIPMLAGETAVEIGSAPGGAAFALLERGLKVCGVDPCFPADRSHAPIVLKSKNFTEVRFYELIVFVIVVLLVCLTTTVASQVKAKLQQLKASQTPTDVHWLLCDANIGAYEAVPPLKELCRAYSSSGSFKGLVYTLKIGDEVFNLAAKSPQKVLQYIETVRLDLLSTGIFDEARTVAACLPSHRQEVIIFAPTKE
jgi:hypothetical protein